MTTENSAGCYFLLPQESQVADTNNMVPPMEDALTKMGFNAVSQATSVPADSVLAVLATFLAGLAGQDAMIQGPLGPTRLPKLDLLTSSADFRIQRLIDQFTSPLERMQRRLPVLRLSMSCGRGGERNGQFNSARSRAGNCGRVCSGWRPRGRGLSPNGGGPKSGRP